MAIQKLLFTRVVCSVSLLLAVLPASALAASSYLLPASSSLDKTTILLAQERKSFTIVYDYGGRDIKIKSSATGKVYEVYYSSPIGAEVGDIVTVIFDGDRWITIINERTGQSSAISSISRIN